MWNPLIEHRGPFQFQITRPNPKKNPKVPNLVEALPGLIDREDVWEEAKALLEDPRDCITSIAVWAMGKGDPYHIMAINKVELDRHLQLNSLEA